MVKLFKLGQCDPVTELAAVIYSGCELTPQAALLKKNYFRNISDDHVSMLSIILGPIIPNNSNGIDPLRFLTCLFEIINYHSRFTRGY